MYKIIVRELLLQQLHNKKQLLIKSILIIATLGLGFFLPFPYLFLLPMVAVEFTKPDMAADTGNIYYLPHIQYILPITRAMLKQYFLIRAGIVAVFYSIVCVLGYVSCYIGTVHWHRGYYEMSMGTKEMGLAHYFLCVLVIAVGFFLYVFNGRVSQYAKECQVQSGTVTPVFLRMGRMTKAVAFFGWVAIALTMTFCASSMMGIILLPEATPRGYYMAFILLAALGFFIYPFVIYREAKQLLVADYQ